LGIWYSIHAHHRNEFHPWTTPEEKVIDEEVAGYMISTIEGMADVLEAHGAVATFGFMPSGARGLCAYQKDNVVGRLLERGHEIHVHVHDGEELEPTVEALATDCGVPPVAVSGLQAFSAREIDPLAALHSSAVDSLELGLDEFLSGLARPPDAGGNSAVFADACEDTWGPNGVVSEPPYHNLLMPWQPDMSSREGLCGEDPDGEMVFVDHAGQEWIKDSGVEEPDPLTQGSFDVLRTYVDAALAEVEANPPDRPVAWGFITHIHEYGHGYGGKGPPDPDALAALDNFYSLIDEDIAAGRAYHTTASALADAVRAR